LQNLDDFISSVEVHKNLTDNRASKLQIKADQMRLTVDSLRNKIELKFEEAASMLEEMKREILRKYDNRWEEIFKGLEDSARELESRIESYDLAIGEITRIRTKSKNPNEELLEFVFDNQGEMEALNEKGQEAKEESFVQAFDRLSTQINNRLMRSMEVKRMSVFAPLRDYFNEILDLKDQKPKLTIEKKPEKGRPSVQRDHSPEEASKSARKHKNSIMEDIRVKLKQYEKLRDASSEEREVRGESREGSIQYSKPVVYQPTNQYRPKNLDLRQNQNKRKPSQDTGHPPLSSDRNHRDYIDNLGRYLDDSRAGFKPKIAADSYRKDAFKPPGGYKFEKRLANPHGLEERSYLNRQARTDFGSTYDPPYASMAHFKPESRQSYHPEPEQDHQKHSSWYFESMKTINDLKNFRDNVRTKLNLTATLPGRPQSKFSTPRYGMY
jgi:uncharacterized membrane-anchored protein YhcB (DUF1043 family)